LGKAGAAFSVPKMVEMKKRISDNLSVFTVELVAVWLALNWVEEVKPEKAVLCSDSSAVLNSLHSFKSQQARQDIIYEILELHTRICQMGITIKLTWVPSHVGVKGNEVVDRLAKQASKQEEVEIVITISKAEAKAQIRSKINKKWQAHWDAEEKGRHLYNIQQKVGTERVTGRKRREGIIFTRLRIGHCGLNKYLHIVGKHISGRCEFCENIETVEHVIFECQKYERER